MMPTIQRLVDLMFYVLFGVVGLFAGTIILCRARRRIYGSRLSRPKRRKTSLLERTFTEDLFHPTKPGRSPGSDIELKNRDCTVCLELFGEGESIKVLPCGHGYHPKCIGQWVDVSDTCPLCRADPWEYPTNIRLSLRKKKTSKCGCERMYICVTSFCKPRRGESNDHQEPLLSSDDESSPHPVPNFDENKSEERRHIETHDEETPYFEAHQGESHLGVSRQPRNAVSKDSDDEIDIEDPNPVEQTNSNRIQN